MLNLTKNTWHYNFWRLNFAGEWGIKTPNQNFCDYFWKLVLAFLLLPITWIGLLIKSFTKNDEAFGFNIFNTILGYIILGTIGIGINIALKHGVWYAIGPVLIILSAVGVILLISYWVVEVLPKSKLGINMKETKDIAVEGWKSFKGKYCPKINWKE